MKLEVRPMTPSDVPSFVTVMHRAFTPGLGRFLYTFPLTSAFIAASTTRTHSFFDVPYVRMLKVVDRDADADADDDDGGRLVAASKWEVFPQGRTAAEVEEAYKPRRPGGHAPYPEFEREFFEFLDGKRREMIGTKACVFLHILITDPEYQGKGAGTLLLKWGMEEADRLGVSAYLESSSVGRPLYERFGFEPVLEKTWRLSDYAPEGESDGFEEKMCIMIRPAKKVEGTA